MKIEVCCGSYIDALNAYKGGADRVELCSCLYFGGLTPSIGSLQLLKENCNIEIATMVRPREGGFCYNEDEFNLILKEGDALIKNGADALVFGFLTNDGYIDFEKTKKMLNMINNRCESVFHKAFDVSKNSIENSLQQFKQLGLTRILTSGKNKTAIDGSNVLKQMIDSKTVGILPAGSVRVHNIQKLHELTGCTYVHTSAFEKMFDNSANNDCIKFTGTTPLEQGEYSLANVNIVSEIVNYAHNL